MKGIISRKFTYENGEAVMRVVYDHLREGNQRIKSRLNVSPETQINNAGIPTILFGSLLAMRAQGISFGKLAAMTSSITNKVAGLELIANQAIAKKWQSELEIDKAVLAEEILNTQSGRYIQLIAKHSGHRIGSVEAFVDGVQTIKFSEVAELHPNLVKPLLEASYPKNEDLYLPIVELKFNLSPL